MRESIDLQTKYEVLLDIDKGVNYRLIAEIHGLKNETNHSEIKRKR